MAAHPAPSPEALLAEHAWLRRLARRLVAGEDEAEELAQEAWIASVESPPSAELPRGPWLARVARNLAINRARDASRRKARERIAAKPEAADSTLDVVERVTLQRSVVEEVLRLAEPYRTTVLLRYWDDLPPREISTRMSTPVETVRTRLKRGVALLRQGLDRRRGGRDAWMSALVPFVRAGISGASGSMASTPLAATGMLVMGTKFKLLAAALVVVGFGWFVRELQTHATVEPETASVRTAAATRALGDAGVLAGPGPIESAREHAQADGQLELALVADSGAPVPGARIVVLRGERLLARGATDARGTFRLAPDDSGADVVVLAPGWAPARFEVDARAGRRTLALAAGATLAGRVLVDDQPPREPIELSFESSIAPVALVGLPESANAALADALIEHGTHHAATQADGTFALRGLPSDASGDLTWPEPYRLARADEGASPTGMRVEKLGAELEIRLTRGLELLLRVVDPDGEPVADAIVRVDLVSDPMPAVRVRHGKTAADGTHRCPLGPVPDSIEVRVASKDGSRAATHALRVPAGQRGLWSVGDLALAPSRALRVRVHDRRGAPVEGALVESRPSGSKHSQRSDASGVLRADIGLDDRQVLVQALGYESALVDAPPDAEEVIATLERASMLEFDVRLAEGAERIRLGIQLTGKPPMFVDESAGALPVLQQAYQGRDPRPQGENVVYRIPLFGSTPRVYGLRAGARLTAALVTADGTVVGRAEIGPLEDGERRKVELVQEIAPKSQRVVVLDAERTPMHGAEVRLRGVPGSSGRTAVDGSVVLTSIYAEPFDVEVERVPFPLRRLHGVRAAPAELEIVLEPPRSIEVELVDKEGTPFDGRIDVWAGLDGFSMQPGTRAGRGRWTVGNLPSGTVVVWAGNGHHRPVTLLHDTRVPRVRLELGHRGRIRARASLPAGAALDAWSIALAAPGSAQALSRAPVEQRNGGSGATFTGLALGDYEVWLETRAKSGGDEWSRVGSGTKARLDAEHETAEVVLP